LYVPRQLPCYPSLVSSGNREGPKAKEKREERLQRDTEGPRQQQRISTYPDKHTSLPPPKAAPTSHCVPVETLAILCPRYGGGGEGQGIDGSKWPARTASISLPRSHPDTPVCPLPPLLWTSAPLPTAPGAYQGEKLRENLALCTLPDPRG